MHDVIDYVTRLLFTELTQQVPKVRDLPDVLSNAYSTAQADDLIIYKLHFRSRFKGYFAFSLNGQLKFRLVLTVLPKPFVLIYNTCL